MRPRTAFPFLRLPEDAISFDGWLIGDPNQPLQPANDLLENWDYARDLEVAATIQVDWLRASAALQIPATDLRLCAWLVAGTGAGQLPRRQDRIASAVLSHSSGMTCLSGTVTGAKLSGRLRLSLTINLAGSSNAGTAISPKVGGARLWTTHHDVLIEDGGDSRFPVETVSFSQVFAGKPQARAPWFVHWRPSALQADFSGNVRLYVNSDHADVVARVASGDSATLQAIMGDVISQMISYAIDQDEVFEMLQGSEEASVGSQISHWIELAFPGQEAASIRAMRNQNPGAFRAAILAIADMRGIA
jgi:hypothetical protein